MELELKNMKWINRIFSLYRPSSAEQDSTITQKHKETTQALTTNRKKGHNQMSLRHRVSIQAT